MANSDSELKAKFQVDFGMVVLGVPFGERAQGLYDMLRNAFTQYVSIWSTNQVDLISALVAAIALSGGYRLMMTPRKS